MGSEFFLLLGVFFPLRTPPGTFIPHPPPPCALPGPMSPSPLGLILSILSWRGLPGSPTRPGLALHTTTRLCVNVTLSCWTLSSMRSRTLSIYSPGCPTTVFPLFLHTTGPLVVRYKLCDSTPLLWTRMDMWPEPISSLLPEGRISIQWSHLTSAYERNWRWGKLRNSEVAISCTWRSRT